MSNGDEKQDKKEEGSSRASSSGGQQLYGLGSAEHMPNAQRDRANREVLLKEYEEIKRDVNTLKRNQANKAYYNPGQQPPKILTLGFRVQADHITRTLVEESPNLLEFLSEEDRSFCEEMQNSNVHLGEPLKVVETIEDRQVAVNMEKLIALVNHLDEINAELQPQQEEQVVSGVSDLRRVVGQLNELVSLSHQLSEMQEVADLIRRVAPAQREEQGEEAHQERNRPVQMKEEASRQQSNENYFSDAPYKEPASTRTSEKAQGDADDQSNSDVETKRDKVAMKEERSMSQHRFLSREKEKEEEEEPKQDPNAGNSPS